MADTKWFKSKVDAQQFLDANNKSGTIRDAGIFADQFGRSFYIINEHAKNATEAESSVKMGMGGIGGSDAIREEKVSKGFNLGDTDNVVMKGDRVDAISYTSQSQAEKGVAELKKFGTEPYISKENGMYVVRFGQPTKEGIKTRNKTVQFDNKEAANLWYEMLTERGAKVNVPELTPEGKYIISEAKGRLYATRELAEEEQNKLKEIGYRTSIEPTEEGVYRLKRLDNNEFETKDEADEYVNGMSGKNIRLRTVGQEDGTWKTIRMSANEFSTEQDAINQQAKLSQKDNKLRTKINRNADGTYTLEKMAPAEYQTKVGATQRQAELNQNGIRTKVETTAEGTNIVRKLADNEFLNKSDAIQQRYNLQKKGINSDVIQGTDGVYKLTTNANKFKGTPLDTPQFNTPIYEKGDEIKAYVQPRVKASRVKIEEKRQEGIVGGQKLQEQGHQLVAEAKAKQIVKGTNVLKSKEVNTENITRKIINKKELTPEEEQYRTNNSQAVENNLKVKQLIGPMSNKEKLQTSAKLVAGNVVATTGKAQKNLANVTAKVQQVGTQAVQDLAPAAAVTATGLQMYGNVQEFVIPKAVKLAKAAIAEYKPAKRLGDTPQRMASQNIPSAPEGAVKVFRTRAEAEAMGERHYKIYDGQGVPRIAARSVRRGSVIGGGTPKIGELPSEGEAPGERLMMGGTSKVGNIETSGSIDFTNNNSESRLPKGREEEGM